MITANYDRPISSQLIYKNFQPLKKLLRNVVVIQLIVPSKTTLITTLDPMKAAWILSAAQVIHKTLKCLKEPLNSLNLRETKNLDKFWGRLRCKRNSISTLIKYSPSKKLRETM